MNIDTVNDPNALADVFFKLSNSVKLGEKELSIREVDALIKGHRHLILKQTENENTAPQLQASMHALHKIITEKNDSNEARALAFEIMGIAIGLIAPAADKADWTNLPEELLENEIFRIIMNKENNPKRFARDLESTDWTSKKWKKATSNAKMHFIGDKSPRLFGCQTAKEAIKFILDNRLKYANLIDFPDATPDDIEYLLTNCQEPVNLSIMSDEFFSFDISSAKLEGLRIVCPANYDECPRPETINEFEEQIATSLARLPNLKGLDLSGWRNLKGEHLAKVLPSLTKLESLHLFECGQISDDVIVALRQLPNLVNLNVSSIYRLEENILSETLEKLPKLSILNIEKYLNFGSTIISVISRLPLSELNLTATNLENEQYITMLSPISTLEKLNLSYNRKLDVDTVKTIVSMLPNLKYLKLKGCYAFRISDIKKLKIEFPNVNIISDARW